MAQLENYKIKTNTVSHWISQLSGATPAITSVASLGVGLGSISPAKPSGNIVNTDQPFSRYKLAADYRAEPRALSLSADPLSAQQAVYRGAMTLLCVAALTMFASTADARWYKWVDESGNISYQDRPPPANYDESTQVLNSQGVTVKNIPSRNEQAKLDAEQEKQKARSQRDEMLIKSFPSEIDLTRTRHKRLGHIDGTVTRMHDQLVILNTRLLLIEEKVTNRIDRGLKPSDALASDRIAVLRSIDSTNALIKSKLKERRHVANKFDDDLIRYRELSIRTQNASLSD